MLIFEILTRLIEEADMLGISEGQIMLLLRPFLSVSAGDQFHASLNSSRSGNFCVIVNWLEVVQHLLRRYTTDATICGATHELFTILPNDNDTETSYDTCLNNPTYCCGNVHGKHEKMTIYVKEFLLSLSTIFSRIRNATLPSALNITFVVHFERKECDEYRARYIVD